MGIAQARQVQKQGQPVQRSWGGGETERGWCGVIKGQRTGNDVREIMMGFLEQSTGLM